MAIQTHVVQVELMQVDNSTNQIFRKDTASLMDFVTRKSSPLAVPDFRTEHRVTATSGVPNSQSRPTVNDYIISEAQDDFRLVHLDQFKIITQNIPAGDGSGGTIPTSATHISGTATTAAPQPVAFGFTSQSLIIENTDDLSGGTDNLRVFLAGAAGGFKTVRPGQSLSIDIALSSINVQSQTGTTPFEIVVT